MVLLVLLNEKKKKKTSLIKYYWYIQHHIWDTYKFLGLVYMNEIKARGMLPDV
jgi:hypothetical protein